MKFKSGDRVWYASGGNEKDTGTIRNLHSPCPFGDGVCYQITWDNGHEDEVGECFEEVDLQFEGKPEDWDNDRPIEFRKVF